MIPCGVDEGANSAKAGLFLRNEHRVPAALPQRFHAGVFWNVFITSQNAPRKLVDSIA